MSDGKDFDLPNGYVLRGLRRLNFLLGKNGSGKSFAFKTLAQGFANLGGFGLVRYITPERAGFLKYDPNVEHQIGDAPGNLETSRRVNQHSQFKQQSIIQYRKLETTVLRKLEESLELNKTLSWDKSKTFAGVLDKINLLLDHVRIQRDELAFSIMRKRDNWKQQPNEISSGESELISLAIECLAFSAQAEVDKENILLLDEPDVHLHPDLQARLMGMLKGLENLENIRVLIATHSTPLIGGLDNSSEVTISFMKYGEQCFQFEPVSEIYTKILPICGAHPLSQVFNEKPILLVEGEDDERVWQQVVRTARGRVRLYPCVAGSVGELSGYERRVAQVLTSVYENPKGFSLRDRDDTTEELEDVPPIIRLQLECRASENLLLTDDVLKSLNTNWEAVCERIDAWLSHNSEHKHFSRMEEFKAMLFPRKTFDLKIIRNDLVGILQTSKPWEVIVGQQIAKMEFAENPAEHSLQAYLGQKVVQQLLGANQSPKTSPGGACSPR